MKLLVLFLILLAALAYVQAERNGCYWHGLDNFVRWSACLTKF